MMPFVAGAGTGPVMIKVNAGNHSSLIAAFSHNNTQLCVLLITLYRITLVTLVARQVAFFVIDISPMYQVNNLILGNISAIHPATGMFGVTYMSRITVETATVVRRFITSSWIAPCETDRNQ
jgi:hypothetical protein